MTKKNVSILLVFSILAMCGLFILLLFWTLDTFGERDGAVLLYGAFLCLLMGGALMLSAVFIRLYARAEGLGCTVPVRAVITGIRQKATRIGDSRHDAFIYMPDYTYLLNGETRTTHTRLGSYDEKRYTIGDEADILIDPEDPTRYYVPGDTDSQARTLDRIWIPLLTAGVALYIAGLLM